MDELTPGDTWDQDPKTDCVDGKEVTEAAADWDADDIALPEDLADDNEWYDCSDEEFMDDDPITEKEVMELARRFGGGL